ncbi:hypothetical protein MIND_01346700 [Mycena indigotica]|uniref:DUF6534 domain-containing protein n=1 Tax=Mycena indigotica TaxID=2126181 RepID=A0A8H6RZ96_9AGAR|nr:uncharacterized protein MIND_01346700 [Mycena indigotica]KAF7289731.1 hypothetical protein MIND_01346700 [Mycena indigotica]
MSAAPNPLAHFDAAPTVGALLIGTLCSYVLFGITTVQAYLYYGRFQDDPWTLKGMVAFVWMFEFAHAASIGHANYFYAVINYGNPRSLLGKMPVSLALSVVLGAIITTLVQSFFAFRIWNLAANRFVRIIPLLLWITGGAYLVGSIAATTLAIGAKNIPSFLNQYGWLLLTPWIVNLINDNVITISLVLLLLSSRSKGFQRTSALVDKLIMWTIETGLITSIFSVLTLAFYQAERTNFVWVGIQFVKARLFANSLLASLNSRQTLRALNASLSDSNGAVTSRGGYNGTNGQTQTGTLNIAMTKVTLREDGGPVYGYKSA